MAEVDRLAELQREVNRRSNASMMARMRLQEKAPAAHDALRKQLDETPRWRWLRRWRTRKAMRRWRAFLPLPIKTGRSQDVRDER